MKRSFLENLLNVIEDESTRKNIINSILDENGNDLNTEKAKIESVRNDLIVKETDLREKEAAIIQNLLKKYVSKTKKLVIAAPEDDKKHYDVDHYTIHKDYEHYEILAYSGPDDIEGTERTVPTEVIADVLFNNLKSVYNEI